MPRRWLFSYLPVTDRVIVLDATPFRAASVAAVLLSESTRMKLTSGIVPAPSPSSVNVPLEAEQMS